MEKGARASRVRLVLWLAAVVAANVWGVLSSEVERCVAELRGVGSGTVGHALAVAVVASGPLGALVVATLVGAALALAVRLLTPSSGRAPAPALAVVRPAARTTASQRMLASGAARQTLPTAGRRALLLG